MARAIWSGSISFGLVNIPVKLFSAISHKEVHFHMLHDADGARINLKRFCSAENVEVPYEHIVKGYELSRGRYVTVTGEELEAADPKGARTVEIQDFVELAEIDPIYYDQTYYLAPDRGAGKAYALLLDAMRRTGKVGIARVVLRSKEALCCVRPMGGALALSTMNHADEVVGLDQLELPESPAPAPRELEMAERLVESLTTGFEPSRYHDTHREKILALIERKAAGEQVVAPPEEAPAKVVNLADALAASLAAARRHPAPAQEPSAAAPARAHRTAPRREAAHTAGHRKKRGGS
ncbi:non-homologous end joining protein Ku [Anaeromyxobacter diazotrophicus]|uniref:Non-homologous end joining protein Ku n=1 Tax=Anaeromyxobacter diazotrophicus TaxID=2590199 RepID=A0A7I9VI73_9BACT|nr:Ku protein [Anaeromyxobacter diazotrophicus]GEJ56116.1 non-homologous end joining protein Ku [Anaeromyxobacter diazotrophicus]